MLESEIGFFSLVKNSSISRQPSDCYYYTSMYFKVKLCNCKLKYIHTQINLVKKKYSINLFDFIYLFIINYNTMTNHMRAKQYHVQTGTFIA